MGNNIKFPIWTNYILFKKFEHLSKVILERDTAQLDDFLDSIDPDQCKELLNKQCNENGSTLLMLACTYGSFDKSILQNIASVNFFLFYERKFADSEKFA